VREVKSDWVRNIAASPNWTTDVKSLKLGSGVCRSGVGICDDG
jgi:hypothetical protein